MARYDYDRGHRRGEPGEQWGWMGAHYPEVWGMGRPPQGDGYAFGYGDWVAPYDYLGTTIAPRRWRHVRDYSAEFRPRPARESGAYGRGGDREVRQWARHHGYDVDAVIRPGAPGGSRLQRGPARYPADYRASYGVDYLGHPIHPYYDQGYQTWRESRVRW